MHGEETKEYTVNKLGPKRGEEVPHIFVVCFRLTFPVLLYNDQECILASGLRPVGCGYDNGQMERLGACGSTLEMRLV